MVGARLGRRRRRRFVGHRRQPAVQCELGHAVRYRRGRRAFQIEHRARLRVLQHEGDPVGRILGVEGDIGAAGREGGEDGGHHLLATPHADPDERIGTDTQPLEAMGEPIDVGRQLPIADHVVSDDQRWRVGCALALRADQLVDAAVAVEVHLRRVPLLQQLMPLAGRQQWHLAQPALRVRHHPFQHRPQARHPAANRIGIEEVGAEPPLQLEDTCRLGHVESEIERVEFPLSGRDAGL